MPIPLETEVKIPEKKVWAVLPEDTYQVEVTDITPEVSEFRGAEKPVFKFEFTIVEEGEYYGRKLWSRGARMAPVPASNNKHPITYRVASAIHKHPFTEDEGKAFGVAGLNGLIGKQLRVTVTVTAPKPDGKQYNNIEAYLMAKSQLSPFDESKVMVTTETVLVDKEVEDFIKPEDIPSIDIIEDEVDVSDIPL